MRTKKDLFKLCPNDKVEVRANEELVLTITANVACQFCLKDFVVIEDYIFKHITE